MEYATTIENQAVELDGNDWVSVRFVNCSILYRGGPLRIDGVMFDACTFDVADQAANTVAFIRLLNQSGVDIFTQPSLN